MSIKQSLTNVAVESAKDFLKERLERLKQLDLDANGKKDVDELIEILHHIGDTAREAIESTDFQKLSTGLSQLVAGVGAIGGSVDGPKLSAACRELIRGVAQLGKLVRSGVEEVKRRGVD